MRGYCSLTQDGVFGINCHLHGIRLCSIEKQRTYRLHEHFRRVHHLTSLASLELARAIGSGQDPMTTRLFDSHHIILNIDELRTVICTMNKPFINYPLLHIANLPSSKYDILKIILNVYINLQAKQLILLLKQLKLMHLYINFNFHNRSKIIIKSKDFLLS